MWLKRVIQAARWLSAAIASPTFVLAALASLTFPLAVLCPFFAFEPRLFDPLFEALVEYTDPGILDPRTYSVVGGIALLFTEGDTAVAIILLLFSVIFPACKLALLWSVLLQPDPARARLVRRLETLGPWSMADVFVVSVSLLAFKAFPGGTTFTIQWGYYLFLTSVVAGLIATWLAKRRLERDSATETGVASVTAPSSEPLTNGWLRKAPPRLQTTP
jgi:paraquat-inducible protein A